MVCEHSHLLATAGTAADNAQTSHWLLGAFASLAVQGQVHLISSGGSLDTRCYRLTEATPGCRVYK